MTGSMGKLHYSLVKAVVENLHQIFDEKRKADKVIEACLKADKRRGSRDRAFIAETTYELVRWYRYYKEMSGEDAPQYLLAAYLKHKGYELPDWGFFNGYTGASKKVEAKAAQLSVPDWMYERGIAEMGESTWERELEAMNHTAPVWLRANILKTDTKRLQKALQQQGIDTEWLPEFPEGLKLKERKNVFTSPLFKEGHFEVQDAGSQKIAPLLEVTPGMRIIDACAGAGGKTLHIATLAQNKGQVISMDIFGNKLQELKRRARRNGVHNVETRLIKNSKDIKRLQSSADRLLLDVPCSGLGVLRRNPDAKWKLTNEFVDTIRETQREILESYSRMLKVGGKMVYATCSLLPSENELQVTKFLDTHPEFELEYQETLFPSKSDTDGFFMAKLVKKS